MELVNKLECSCERCSAPVDGELHTCPYQEDINDDHESLCNCCVTAALIVRTSVAWIFEAL